MEPTGISPLRQRSLSPQRTTRREVQKTKHPFVNDENRNNFPNLDEVLAAPPASVVEDSVIRTPKGVLSKSPQQSTSPNNQDQQSITGDGSTITASSSTMCLSIGARAALTEHLRHISKYGLDDGSPVKAIRQQQKRSPLEEEWERLMDGNTNNNMDDESTETEEIPLCCIMNDDDGTEAVEVMTVAADRSDYFNTSRVLQLMTPEKLRVNNSSIAAVTTRRRAEASEGGGATTTNSSDTASLSSGHHLFQAAMDMHEQQRPMDSSFLSFSAVDVSRLSVESDLLLMKRSSPDESFQAASSVVRGESDNNNTARDLLPPINMTPSRIRRDVLFSSPMSMVGMRRGSNMMMTSPSPHRQQQQRRQQQKENDEPNFSDIGLSPIAALAGSTARKLKPGSREPAFPFPTFDGRKDPPGQNLGETIDSLRNEAPSPISQSVNLSGFQLLAQDMSGLDVSTSDRMNSSGESPRPRSTPGTTAERHPAIVSSSRSFPMDLTDRRRYRSVVPRRVLMDADQEESVLRDDSFSTPPSAVVGNMSSESACSSPRQVSKSLLGSFDAVYADAPVDLDDSS